MKKAQCRISFIKDVMHKYEMETQDLNVEICDSCRELIGRAIKELVKEDKE